MSGILDPLISALGGGGAATSSAASRTSSALVANPTSTSRQATSSAALGSSSAPAPASSSPSPSPSPSPSATSAAPSEAAAPPAGGGNTGSDSTSGLAIGGGIVAGLAIVAVGVMLLVYRRRRKRKSDAENFRSSTRVNKAMSSSWLSDSEPGTGSGWLGGRSPATTISTAEYVTAAGNHIHEGYQGSNSGSQQHNIMSDVRLPSPTSTGMHPSTTYTSSLPPSKISSGFMSQSLGWNLHQNQNQLSIPPSLASYPPSTVANYIGATEPSTSLSAANITALTRTLSGFSKDSTSTITPSNFRSRNSKIQGSSQLSPRTNSSFRYSQGSLSNFRVPASVALSWSSRSQIGGTDSVSWKKGGVRERWEVRQGALYVVQESRDSSGRGLLSVRAGDVVLVVGLPIDGWIEGTSLPRFP
ncbi:hypothetical protein M427DRAFT_69023 [Gonapodya prolifera JEL478]|uniref:SH3 domain-containing protein n=1 Tax=Gonapodya prolifera (strain JEL478) TaxID=1344416 RepID=A0A139AHW8_GONPJ|nr:hypothetical protein M427DRAFT_69023 [Gonapodya prolifera JEL478]|eukprot:KXS16421.1 hypothetical protein M427DRAFT_69023 [Gonapodya prolifera JEL478]